MLALEVLINLYPTKISLKLCQLHLLPPSEMKRYAFVPMEDDPAPVGAASSSATPSRKQRVRHRSRSRSPRRSKTKSIRQRHHQDAFEDRWGDQDPSDHEPEPERNPEPEARVSREPTPKRMKRSRSPEMSEEARDIAEREAFARRLRQRDEDRTKKVVEDRSSRSKDGLADHRRRLAEDLAARDAALPDLREKSRQEYFKKREAEKVALLRKAGGRGDPRTRERR